MCCAPSVSSTVFQGLRIENLRIPCTVYEPGKIPKGILTGDLFLFFICILHIACVFFDSFLFFFLLYFFNMFSALKQIGRAAVPAYRATTVAATTRFAAVRHLSEDTKSRIDGVSLRCTPAPTVEISLNFFKIEIQLFLCCN